MDRSDNIRRTSNKTNKINNQLPEDCGSSQTIHCNDRTTDDYDGDNNSDTSSDRLFQCAAISLNANPEHMVLVHKLRKETKNLKALIKSQHKQIKKLEERKRVDTLKYNQIRDLNIKLQIKLDRLSKTEISNYSKTEGTIRFKSADTLAKDDSQGLDRTIADAHDDASIVLLNHLPGNSVGESKSLEHRNIANITNISQDKIDFIKAMLRERVIRENVPDEELKLRCDDERVNRLIHSVVENINHMTDD